MRRNRAARGGARHKRALFRMFTVVFISQPSIDSSLMAASRRRGVGRRLSCKENLPPPSPFPGESTPRPVSEKIAAMRERWVEQSQGEGGETARSPTLVQLRGERGWRDGRGSVWERQKELERLHHEAKSRREGVGGGVSLWPEMDDMRLSRRDTLQLGALCLFLSVTTAALFLACHGENKYTVL